MSEPYCCFPYVSEYERELKANARAAGVSFVSEGCKLGRPWHYLREPDFVRMGLCTKRNLECMFESDEGGERRVFFRNATTVFRDPVDTTWLGGYWANRRAELERMVLAAFGTSRPIELFGLEGGTFHHRATPGKLRIALHAGASSRTYRPIGLSPLDDGARRPFGIKFPGNMSWYTVTNDGGCFLEGGEPMAQLIRDDLLLVLPDLAALGKNTDEPLEALRKVFALVTSPHRGPVSLQYTPAMPRGSAPGSPISVKIVGARLERAVIIDTTGGQSVRAVLAASGVVSADSAHRAALLLNGAWAQGSEVPANGDTITLLT